MKVIISSILIFFTLTIFANKEGIDVKAIFWDAETFFYEKDYKEALTLYRKLIKEGKFENANINYRIGICYLKGYNRNADKIKAIPYLEKAVQVVTKDYKEGELTEEKAHEDAYIYLGDAYALNNKLDKAIGAYNEFKEISETTDEYYLNIVNRKIETCESAKKLEHLSIKYTLKNLGNKINNQFANYNAVASGDGSMLVYTSDMKFYEAVFYSQKVNGEYTVPKNLNVEAKIEGNVLSVGISYDGKELYLFKDGGEDEKGNIYTTTFDGTKWSKIKKLNNHINTSDLERYACPSKDGKTLYFSSNRKGGEGSLDIYKSIKQPNGEWGPAINLGPKINSKFDDVAPFLLNDEKTLYFSSQGHYYNMGGKDLFMSKMNEDSTWTTPLNFGYPLNTTDDNMFLFPLKEKGKALISLASDDGYGDLDIYEVTFYPQDEPAVLLTGKLNNKNKEINVTVLSDGKEIKKIKTDKTGKISIQTKSEDIKVTFNAEDMDNASKSFTVPKVYCLAEINLSDIKLKHKITAEELAKMNNAKLSKTIAPAILFGFDKTIPEKYKEDLNKLADYLNKSNNILLEIGGYADIQGDDAYNMILSEKRANFVKDYLLSKSVSKDKLQVKAYGEQHPISVNLNPQSRKYNRRVQFKIIRDEAGKLKVLLPEVPDNYKIK